MDENDENFHLLAELEDPGVVFRHRMGGLFLGILGACRSGRGGGVREGVWGGGVGARGWRD